MQVFKQQSVSQSDQCGFRMKVHHFSPAGNQVICSPQISTCIIKVIGSNSSASSCRSLCCSKSQGTEILHIIRFNFIYFRQYRVEIITKCLLHINSVSEKREMKEQRNWQLTYLYFNCLTCIIYKYLYYCLKNTFVLY